MTEITWDGYLPLRRYAIFTDVIRGNYAIVIKGDDINTADKWGGFVSWLGGVRQEELRAVCKPNVRANRGTTA